MKEKDFMLTTFDNSFNPFKEFESWWKEDLRLMHDTCGLLARTANTSSIFSDEVNEEYIDKAMNEIVSRFPTVYRKVSEEDFIDQEEKVFVND